MTALLQQFGLQLESCSKDWADQAAWRVLDASFGDGTCWREYLAAWRADRRRPRLLHYAALITPAQEMVADAPPDFQRHEFDDGQALLTLFGGELNTALRELRMVADTVLLPPLAGPDVSVWTAKLLARNCRRGTRIFAQTLDAPAVKTLAAQGFALQQQALGASWAGHYNPGWDPKERQLPELLDPHTARRCIVIGAGLAGASTAYALSRRGWAVQVLDTASAPAMGASGLPLGLMAHHTSADDNPRSRLTRAGVHMTTAHTARLLSIGQDWAGSGVLTQKAGAAPSYCADGVWIKPKALVAAWLAQPGIAFQSSSPVAGLAWRGPPDSGGRSSDPGGEWRVLAADGRELASAPLVVLAAATGCTDILRGCLPIGPNSMPPPLPNLTGVPGQVSWAAQLPGDGVWTPSFCVNGNGYVAANVPIDGVPAWLAGATFEDESAPLEVASAQRENFGRLQILLPGAAAALKHRFDAGAVQHWRGTRCTTPDRLPRVGPVGAGAPGVWLNTGFGSRGLTWSVLCAEWLAARLHGEPWPVAASLAHPLNYRGR